MKPDMTVTDRTPEDMARERFYRALSAHVRDPNENPIYQAAGMEDGDYEMVASDSRVYAYSIKNERLVSLKRTK